MSEHGFRKLEGKIKRALSGDMLKNALDFAAYMKANGMTLDIVTTVYSYLGKEMCCLNERRLHKCSDYFYEGDTIFMPIFEKLGFKREGVKRQEVFHKGRYWDEIHYGLLAEEFDAQQMQG